MPNLISYTTSQLQSISPAQRIRSYYEKFTRWILFSSSSQRAKIDDGGSSQRSIEEEYVSSRSWIVNSGVSNSTVSLPSPTFFPSDSSSTTILEANCQMDVFSPVASESEERPYINIEPTKDGGTSANSIRIKLNSEGRKILIRRRFSEGPDDLDFTPPPSPTRKLKDSFGIGNDSITDFDILPERRKSDPIDASSLSPPVYHRSISLPTTTTPINPHFRAIDAKRKLSKRRGLIKPVVIEK